MVRPDRREGRGRLSSFDMLPPEAEEDQVWALAQLRERSMPQNVIFEEFNERLADKGIRRISRSAFNRKAVRYAIQFRRQDEGREIMRELVQTLNLEDADNTLIAVTELLKLAVFERLEDGDSDPQTLMLLGRAVTSASAARKLSAEDRMKREKADEDRKVRVGKALDETGKKLKDDPKFAADPAAVLQKIREDVYGIFDR